MSDRKKDLDRIVELSLKLDKVSRLLAYACTGLEETNNMECMPQQLKDWWEHSKRVSGIGGAREEAKP